MSQSSEYIDPQELKALSSLQPWRTVLAIALDWTIIFAAAIFSEWADSWLAWLVAVPVIAGRMHALGTMMHEFAHYRFIRNKALSEWLGDIFVAWPIGATVEGYRRNHLAHHRYTNTGKDPDWEVKLGTRVYTFPQEMRFALLNFLGYFLAVSSFRDISMAYGRMQADDLSSTRYKLLRIGFYAAIIGAVVYFGVIVEYLLYWLIPYLTLFYLFLYIRSVAEHFGETMEPLSQLKGTRTVLPYFWERWFFCPHNINYHLDHHLYPSVPFYNLPRLNRLLMRSRGFQDQAHITRGYTTGLLKEVWLNS